MRFVHTNMRVRDIEASLRFYEALGFEPDGGARRPQRSGGVLEVRYRRALTRP